MPKLVKLETDANVSNYTPEEGKITTFFVEEDGVVKQKFKNSSGQIVEFTQNGENVVEQPVPSINYQSSSGIVSAAYNTVGGRTVGRQTKSATLQLPTDPVEQIVLKNVSQAIPSGYFLTKDITIPPVQLDPSQLAKGYNPYGYTGTFAGSVDPIVPDNCLCFLHNMHLYERQGLGIDVGSFSIHGLPDLGVVEFNGTYWRKYGPFGEAGAFAGSALSQDGVYLEWDGFSKHTLKYTIHTLIGDTDASSVYDAVKYAWGFDEQDYNWEDNYELSGLEMYWYSTGYDWDGAGARFYDGWFGRTIMKAGLLPAAFTWDGPGNVAVNLITARGDRYKRTLMYPYDEEMGMPGQKYIVGNKLYLGKPPRYTNGISGAIIGGFALEVGSSGYTDGASYISPLLDGTYKNL